MPLFGSLESDWSRLAQLHKKLPENSRLQGNLGKLYRLLAVAYLEVHHSMKNTNNLTRNVDNISTKNNNICNINQNSKLLNKKKSVEETSDKKDNLATQSSDNNFDNKNKLTNNSMVNQGSNDKIEIQKILEYLQKELFKNLTATFNLNEKNKQYSYQGNRVYESKKNKKSTDFINSVLANESTTINYKSNNFASRYEQTTLSIYREKNLPIINREKKLKINNKTTVSTLNKINNKKKFHVMNEKNNSEEINILQRLIKNDLNNHYYYDFRKNKNSTL